MSIAIIQEKLRSYNCQTMLEEEHALKEIAQEITLLALSRAGFFREVAFQGGTCLRILYRLERFSEDLDFILHQPNKNFIWSNFLTNIKQEFELYGFELEVQDRDKADDVIKKAFLKTNSIGNILLLDSARSINSRKKFRIKLEIDINPPLGSEFEIKYLDFPIPFSVNAQDMPSLFAGKCHALLCREYVKGRDWYDFVWYVARKVPVNVQFLKNALHQFGPWQGQELIIDKSWLLEQFNKRITEIDWNDAKKDVARFLKPNDLFALDVWSEAFFRSRLEKMAEYL